MRPKKLVAGNIKGIDVVLYAIDWLKENDKRKQYDLIMLVQHTSSLGRSENIDKAIELLFFKKNKSNCFGM
jgi:CMP-N-acetylneuraminic acid synthetase